MIHGLHRHRIVDCQARGGCGALAGDHEDLFHADAAEGSVTGREREGDEQVFAFAGFRTIAP